MPMVIFKAVLKDGGALAGPIGGAGGMLGSGVPPHKASRYAMARIRSLQHVRPFGSVRIYPNYGVTGDGDPVRVPLSGTDFSIIGE